MGLLDSNKVAMQTKTITIASKVVTVTGSYNYITEGLVDVRGYDTAIFKITGASSSVPVKSVGNILNGTPTYQTNIYSKRIKNFIDVIDFTNEYEFVADVSQISYWGLVATASGTFDVTIQLSTKSLNSVIGSIIKNSIDSLQGSFLDKTDNVTISFNGNTGIKHTVTNIGRDFNTACIEVKFNDSTPVKLRLYKFTADGDTELGLGLLRDIKGEFYTSVEKTGVYLVDISGIDVLKIKNESSSAGSGTMYITLLKSKILTEPKPIQVIWQQEKTLESSSTSATTIISNAMIEKNLISIFKFIRVEINYTGIGTPNGKIKCSDGANAVYKEVGEINTANDTTDWFMNPVGTDLRVLFDFGTDFTPSANSTMKFIIYGMR